MRSDLGGGLKGGKTRVSVIEGTWLQAGAVGNGRTAPLLDARSVQAASSLRDLFSSSLPSPSLPLTLLLSSLSCVPFSISLGSPLSSPPPLLPCFFLSSFQQTKFVPMMLLLLPLMLEAGCLGCLCSVVSHVEHGGTWLASILLCCCWGTSHCESTAHVFLLDVWAVLFLLVFRMKHIWEIKEGHSWLLEHTYV